ncbi:MAG: AMIN domain-containing protein [Desulfobacterales bacterium]|nr:AMIN domain-containing protein [Desulfobacterales bacterium]
MGSAKMTFSLSNPGSGRLPVILMTALLMLWYGCNQKGQSTMESPMSTQIVDIQITEEDNAWNCKISGNRPLTFSAINNLSPTGLLLYFPDTRLEISQSDLPSPVNEIIGFIEAEEYQSGSTADSRILIGLNVARPYRISAAEADTLISFPKVLAKSSEREHRKEPPGTIKMNGAQPETAAASVLQQVTAVPMKDYIIIHLIADGTIRDYRSFSIDNPARIVFDIHNVRSRFSNARTIAIDARWVKRIRYHSYPDKIRLVLDTEQQFLADHFSFGTESGLLIYVGKMPKQIQRSLMSSP